MGTISRFWISKSAIEDKTDRESTVRDTLHIMTSDRMSWTQLRLQSVIPKYGSEHPREPGFFLEAMKPTQSKRCYWEVELEYNVFKAEQIDPSPLARPAEITWSTSLVEQPTERDSKGRPTCTTAGEFLTGIVEKIPLVEYSIKKNLPADPAWAQTHFGCVNQDAIKIRGLDWAPGTLMLISGSGGPFTVENKVSFMECSLSLLGDYRGWTLKVWNRGTVRLAKQKRTKWKLQGGKLIPVEQSVWVQVPILTGEPPAPVEEPVFLDDYGQEIIDALKPEKGSTLDPTKFIELTFDIQSERKFAGVLPLV